LVALTVERISITVEEMHEAIARPWFRLAGPAEKQLRVAYTGATSGVYRSVRAVTSLAGRASDSLRDGSQADPVSQRSDSVQAFMNAVWGDEIARRGSSMAINMHIRDGSGAVVDLDARSLGQAFTNASGRVVILLHGLGQTERLFMRSGAGPSMTEALAEASLTPVMIRYNSGRTVGENGTDLSILLRELAAGWPVPVTEIALVGFSMGGLVARAAIAAGRSDEEPWAELVRHVVTIATPHGGSPIEKAAEAASRALMLAPQSRPLGRFLAQRSQGIRDLHSGPDLPRSFDRVEHHLIAGVTTANASHPIGALVGDLVVRRASATGLVGVRADDRVVIGGRRHFDILDDPSIAERVIDWIGST
jgi:pimeloyl-ACP methyl ester carboxylesterase